MIIVPVQFEGLAHGLELEILGQQVKIRSQREYAFQVTSVVYDRLKELTLVRYQLVRSGDSVNSENGPIEIIGLRSVLPQSLLPEQSVERTAEMEEMMDAVDLVMRVFIS